MHLFFRNIFVIFAYCQAIRCEDQVQAKGPVSAEKSEPFASPTLVQHANKIDSVEDFPASCANPASLNTGLMEPYLDLLAG